MKFLQEAQNTFSKENGKIQQKAAQTIKMNNKWYTKLYKEK